MKGIIVDSSVLLDVMTRDPAWYSWSYERLARLGDGNRLLINAIIYAELSVGFEDIEDLESAVGALQLNLIEIPRAALFLAGKAFLGYRRRGGRKSAPLPDFFIGAHAAVLGVPLVTRDARRVRRHFPTLELISPA
jgi:hypothetical protein